MPWLVGAIWFEGVIVSYKVHCTKKLLDKTNPLAADEAQMESKRYGDEANQAKALAEAQWHEDNAAAIQSSNAYVDKHGLPFKLYRVK